VVSGQWSVGQWSAGQWSVVSGQWSVVSGQWSVVSDYVYFHNLFSNSYRGALSFYTQRPLTLNTGH